MQRLDLERRPAGLQERPITQQFHMVDLGPRLDESFLRSRKATADAFNRIESERGKVRLDTMHGSADGGEVRQPP